MTDDTILVVDADPETEEKIVSALEAENCLVFTASGGEVSAELAGKIRPSLIFLKPTAPSVEGFQTCKVIHNMEAFKNVPIVLLASLKEPMDDRYTTFYGIVDFLKMPLNADMVIEKTEKILGFEPRNVQAPEEEFGLSEENASQKEPLRLQEKLAFDSDYGIGSRVLQAPEEEYEPLSELSPPAEEKSAVRKQYYFDGEPEEVSEIGEPNEDYTYNESQENLSEGLESAGSGNLPKRRGLLIPVIMAISGIAIVAAGFLLYRFFTSAPEVKVPIAFQPRDAVQQQEPSVPPLQEQQQPGEPPAEAGPEATKKVPKETPAAVSEAKPAGKPFYSVQIGAFSSEGGAAALAKTFKGKGYEAFTQKGTTKDNATIYRVLIGQYENRKEALRLAGKIRDQDKIGTTVFVKK
ncbi:MAG: SPOR domain-containing protein [Nitrospirota bacterium]|nr:SPOR domain-containing protein [Nitrospirota bacterium]